MPLHSIPVVSAIGSGRTTLSAFDSALRESGIADTNLIRLSSVIPPGWEPVDVRKLAPFAFWGDRLYVVQSHAVSDQVGMHLAAGIGWCFLDFHDMAIGGLFVEHHAEGQSGALADIEQYVREQIFTSLEDLASGRGYKRALRIGWKIVGATVENDPTCALVTAVYGAESWQSCYLPVVNHG